MTSARTAARITALLIALPLVHLPLVTAQARDDSNPEVGHDVARALGLAAPGYARVDSTCATRKNSSVAARGAPAMARGAADEAPQAEDGPVWLAYRNDRIVLRT